ncbi:MAG: SEC-C metal-binding domain-containing protein [bacterium]|nr:SEC-C metal-binding domain-containing protein [bacterium]
MKMKSIQVNPHKMTSIQVTPPPIHQHFSLLMKDQLVDFLRRWAYEPGIAKWKKDVCREKAEEVFKKELPQTLYLQALTALGNSQDVLKKILTEGAQDITFEDSLQGLEFRSYIERFGLFDVGIDLNEKELMTIRVIPYQETLDCAKEHLDALMGVLGKGDRIVTYAKAIANVYGCLPLYAAYEMYVKLDGAPVSFDDFIYGVFSFRGVNNHTYRINAKNHIVSMRYFDTDKFHILNEVVEEVIAAAKKYPQWRPNTAEELLQYADFKTFQNEVTPLLDQWLEKQFAQQPKSEVTPIRMRILREQILRFTTDIHSIHGLNNFFEWMHENFKIPLNQRTFERFVSIFDILHNSLPLPENNGHSPKSLRRTIPETHPDLSQPMPSFDNPPPPPFPMTDGRPKIGRNDPCPCGSGKKYKHCCGK